MQMTSDLVVTISMHLERYCSEYNNIHSIIYKVKRTNRYVDLSILNYERGEEENVREKQANGMR